MGTVISSKKTTAAAEQRKNRNSPLTDAGLEERIRSLENTVDKLVNPQRQSSIGSDRSSIIEKRLFLLENELNYIRLKGQTNGVNEYWATSTV